MNYYSRGSSVTDMIKESNLDSVELWQKVKKDKVIALHLDTKHISIKPFNTS